MNRKFCYIPDLSVLAAPSASPEATEAYRRFCDSRDSLRRLIAESQCGRTLPTPVVQELVSAGILRLLLPLEFGGLEIDPACVLVILEELACVSGSLAWTAMVAAETPILLSLLPRSTFESIYENGPDVMLASSGIPAGQATKVNGGWIVSGVWPYATGSAHCHLVLTHARASTGGIVVTLHPRHDVTFIDDWRSTGLKGTSTQSIVLKQSFSPDVHSFKPEGARSCCGTPVMTASPSEHFSLQMAAVATGIVRHAIDKTTSDRLGGHRAGKRLFEGTAMFDAIGKATAVTRIARSALCDAMSDLILRTAQSEEQSSIAPTQLSVSRYIVDCCLASVEGIVALSGSAVVFEDNELQECAADLRCLAQHSNLSPGRFAQLGATLMKRKSEKRAAEMGRVRPALF